MDHCPFCNGELPKEKTQSCLDAAIAEADKIELRIKDLQYADEALSKEMDKLQSQREALVREQQQVQAAIRGELRPQVEALRDKLAIFTAALEKAKAKEMLKHFTEVLNEQLLRIKNEDEFSNDFDVREKIREVLQEPLERLLTEILEKCNYDNYVGSRFDEDIGRDQTAAKVHRDEAERHQDRAARQILLAQHIGRGDGQREAQ